MNGIHLALDASTYSGSAALITRGGSVIAVAEARMRGEREERFLPTVAQLLQQASVAPGDLKGIICGAGPGSFTSLRIAASIAKGFAMGLDVPLYSVTSLLLTPAAAAPPLAPGEYLSLLDAMRGEFHALRCVVDQEGRVTSEGEVELLPEAGLPGAGASASALTEIGPGRTIDAAPHARGVALMMPEILGRGRLDASSWEPDYGRLPEAEVRLEGPTNLKVGI